MISPSADQLLAKAKSSDNADKCGMFLVHNGTVRIDAKKKAREGAADTLPVKGMEFSYDSSKVDSAIKSTYLMPGIYYVDVWLNSGTLSVGDDIMYVVIGGDIRPHVVDALQSLVDEIKHNCVEEKELF